MEVFPKDFLWGAATSSYQVEGNNAYCDWWKWEKDSGLKEVSGQACRHYQLYKEDFELAKSLNHNVHRLSIEWSRIEPRQGDFLDLEIQHYIKVIDYLKGLGIEPVVTLYHFTLPSWVAELGGWQNKETIDYFLRYVSRLIEALSGRVKYWVTINEPNVYVRHCYVIGQWPPQEKSLKKARLATDNLISAHIRAYDLIHKIYKEKNLPCPKLSIAQNMQAFVPCNKSFRNRFSARLRHKVYNLYIIDKLIRRKKLDFIGLNYYSRTLVEADSWRAKDLFLGECRLNHHPLKKNSLGWDIYPQGLYDILLDLKKRYGLAVFILENGICTEDDSLRRDFIREHLVKLSEAIAQGCDVLGYIYWSLIDNYEWDKGFAPRFGLVGVDYNTYKRQVRQSAKDFADFIKTGRF